MIDAVLLAMLIPIGFWAIVADILSKIEGRS